MTLPFILCILDGWGHRTDGSHNAISKAKNWERMWQDYPHTLLDASQEAVGLPSGQMGNSEVGHTTIGLGRVIEQDLPRVHRLIKEKQWKLPQAKRCHIIALMSRGGIHSHLDHIEAAIAGMPNTEIFLHGLLDGRDTPPQNALHELGSFDIKHAKWATLGGRYYGMDRDKRWDRTHKAMQAIMYAQSSHSLPPHTFCDPNTYIQDSYQANITDEFIEPAVHEHYEGMKPGDHVLIMNFRADRVRQLTHTLTTFTCGEENLAPIPELTIEGLVDYGMPIPSLIPKPQHSESLGEIVAKANLQQHRIAETEKYAHVTFFFNGGSETPFPGENRVLIPSPQVATYDLQPEMAAYEVLDATLEAMDSPSKLIVVNFANPDMVGHTGNWEATCQAIETVDNCLARLEQKALQKGWNLIITADHGNAEMMQDDQNRQHTAHTCNLVPFVWVSNTAPQLCEHGTLADITPTILHTMGLHVPKAITGKDLRTL